MSDSIKHECGIAFIRLLKPLEFYVAKYSTSKYGQDKLYLLMEKQHNRGQDGAGVANIKINTKPGEEYIFRYRSNSSTAIKDIFDKINYNFEQVEEKHQHLLLDSSWLKQNLPFTGEMFLGHLRYGTYGKNGIEFVHPLLKQNNWRSRNLVIAGNFNLTNVEDLFKTLVEKGQHPYQKSDTVTVLEKIGHFLDKEVEKTFRIYKNQGYNNIEISKLIEENLNVQNILLESCKRWDGGYAIAGMFGHGDAFVVRDPAGIRPAYYYADDEVVVVASERPAIQTAFNVRFETVKEIQPGHALIIKNDGSYGEFLCKEPLEKKSCSFERIYFSRGTDSEIYKERKMLGKLLCPAVLKSINNDFENTVFSFIPNTAAVAFNGLVEEIHTHNNKIKKEKIIAGKGKLSDVELDKILTVQPRIESIAVKDAKLRTFITGDAGRNDLVAHVYDVTYGIIKNDIDTLVVLDDSIVRGTTLKQSIFRILDRLKPKRIIVLSSAPQIRFPDCYGIDMAKLSELIAFEAAIELLKKSNRTFVINTVYQKCKAQENKPFEEIINYVKEIYEPFTPEQISAKITELLRPDDINADTLILFQTVENLHKACPESKGDWYFTGDYPTPGGNKVACRSFINYIEGRNERAY